MGTSNSIVIRLQSVGMEYLKDQKMSLEKVEQKITQQFWQLED